MARDGTDTTTTLSGVIAQNFSAGAAILVSGLGKLAVQAGTQANGSLRGMELTDSANVTVSSTTHTIQFNNNTNEGIRAVGTAQISISGTAATGGSGTVVANNNAFGFFLAQDTTNGTPPLCTLTGFVAYKNFTDGIHVEGGSSIKVRNSFVGANAIGVNIIPGSRGATSFDTSNMDFGKDAASDPGKNVLQSPAADTNTTAGVCYAMQNNNNQSFNGFGNTWLISGGTLPIDCTVPDAGPIATSSSCSNAIDLAGSLNGNNIGVAFCTVQ